MTCRPGHAPKHPDFAPGNVAALRHGAWAKRLVDPAAEELLAATEQTVDWWRECDRPAAWAWARTEVRIQRLTEWLASQGGDIDGDGAVRPAAALLSTLEARAESLRARLGLDPLSRARLGRDVAASQVDLARLWASEDDTMADDHPGDATGPHVAVQRARTACRHGDPLCPCQEGDSCNYEGNDPSRCPTTGIVGCTECQR